MAQIMNRKEWLKSSGLLLAGGMSGFTSGLFPAERTKKEIAKDAFSSRKFVSDEEFMRLLPMEEIQARLSANENPFGPSEKAKEAIRNAIDGCYQYTFRDLRGLAEKIADHEKVDSARVLLAAGSSPILHAGALCFTRIGGNIVTGDPSYNDLPEKAGQMGSEIRRVPLNDEYKLDLKAMEAEIDENTSLVYICNPNNPTATVLDTEELKAFCKRVSAKIPVFIDEAYIDYLDEPDTHSMMSLVSEGYNMMVARTFSKLYGFAGLRVGYMVATKELAEKIGAYTRGGMSISATSGAAALAAYLDPEFTKMVKTKTSESKEFLLNVLGQEGYTPIPSATNFVLFPIHLEGRRFIQEMAKRGVSVRSWNFGGQHWCRVTVGTLPEMEIFANAFKQIS